MDQKEMQYACTKCMNWFDFDDLSADIQMCKGCTEKNIATSSKASETTEKKDKDTKRSRPENCKYCHTYIKVKVPGEKRICERCLKNRKEYGEPKICVFCQLNSAFIGTKCQRCSSSKKKYGMPVDCKKCNLKAAFDHKKARIEGELLCWKCYISTQRNKIREKRKGTEYDDKTEETDVKRSRESETTKKSSPDENERTWRELLGEDYGSKSARKTESNSARADKKHELRIQAQLNSRNSRKSDLDDRISKMEKRVATPPVNTVLPVKNEAQYNSRSKRKSDLDDRIYKMEKSVPTPPFNTASPWKNEDKAGSNTSTPRLGAIADSRSNPSTPTPGTPTNTSHKSTDRLRNGALDLSTALPQMNDNIVLVTKLREEINSLKKQLLKKDQLLFDKEKQISILKVEHLQSERALQAKLKSQEDDFFTAMESSRAKNQEQLKKIALLSKKKS